MAKQNETVFLSQQIDFKRLVKSLHGYRVDLKQQTKMTKIALMISSLLIGLLILSGFNNTNSSKTTTKKETKPAFDLAIAEKEIEEANRNLMDVVTKGDSVVLTNSYAPDARFMSAAAPAVAGRANIQKARTDIMKSGITKVDIKLKELFNIQKQNTIDIKDYQWSHRLICIETNDKSEAIKQLSSFNKSGNENLERKLKFFVKISNTYFEGLELLQVDHIKNFPTKLKAHKFSMALIGLDGGIKHRWHKQTEATEIYQKIDAMPMRMSEYKKP